MLVVQCLNALITRMNVRYPGELYDALVWDQSVLFGGTSHMTDFSDAIQLHLIAQDMSCIDNECAIRSSIGGPCDSCMT